MNYKIKERILKNLLIEITKKYDYLISEFKTGEINKKTKLMYDYVTELLNRDGLKEKMRSLSKLSKKENKKIAIIAVDLDNFKIINTSYGHEIGDIFLKNVAKTLRKISGSNWIVARTGGDEFMIIIYGTSYISLPAEVERIKNEIENLRIKVGDSVITTTASFGVSVYDPLSDEDIMESINKAEVGIYQSKTKGKSRITFSTEKFQEKFRQLEEKKRIIEQALNKPENILVFIQPIVSLSNEEIIGGEILLRILNNGKIIPAFEFIEPAETFGLLNRLEEVQLNKFFDFPDLRKLKGKHIFINRHITDDNVYVKDLIDRLSIFREKTGINLVIEITENSFVQNFSILKQLIFYAKEKGILFALDDFGAGFASFGYVSKVPVDIIKIDGSIIEECIHDKKHQAILKAIAVLSKDLNIKTVAEFIDSPTKKEKCTKFDINYGQGFLFSKPVELSEFIKML